MLGLQYCFTLDAVPQNLSLFTLVKWWWKLHCRRTIYL